MKERLDKFLSRVGVCERSKVSTFIRSKEILINENFAIDKGQKIDTENDKIFFLGKQVFDEKNIYLMMNKPQNYISSNKDDVYQSVFSLLEEKYTSSYYKKNLHIVGRLDVDTEGLLLFTTDGSLTHKIISPKKSIQKKYFVRLKKSLSNDEQNEYIEKFQNRIFIKAYGDEKEHLCESASLLWHSEKECTLSITEGKYHQVKRMFLALENEVVFLKRVSIGNLELDEDLKLGEFRKLSEKEIEILKSM